MELLERNIEDLMGERQKRFSMMTILLLVD